MALMAAGQIGAVTATLAAVAVDEATIAAIKKILEGAREDLSPHGEGGLKPLPTGVTGGSATGAELERHTGLAHQHMVDSMQAMMEIVTGYSRGITEFYEEMTDQDGQVRDALYRGARATGVIAV